MVPRDSCRHSIPMLAALGSRVSWRKTLLLGHQEDGDDDRLQSCSRAVSPGKALLTCALLLAFFRSRQKGSLLF